MVGNGGLGTAVLQMCWLFLLGIPAPTRLMGKADYVCIGLVHINFVCKFFSCVEP